MNDSDRTFLTFLLVVAVLCLAGPLIGWLWSL